MSFIRLPLVTWGTSAAFAAVMTIGIVHQLGAKRDAAAGASERRQEEIARQRAETLRLTAEQTRLREADTTRLAATATAQVAIEAITPATVRREALATLAELKRGKR